MAAVKREKGQPTETRMGRPTLLTPALQKRLVEKVRSGLYLETVAYRCRIDPVTFFRWMERGQAGEPPYADFCKSIKVALAEAEEILWRRVKKGGPQWQRFAWMMERRWPAKYGRRADLAAIVQQEMQRLLTKAKEVLPDEHMDRLEQALAAPDDSLGVADATRERAP